MSLQCQPAIPGLEQIVILNNNVVINTGWYNVAFVSKIDPPYCKPAIDGPAFPTIASAVKAIKESGRQKVTIYVLPGVYDEQEDIVLPDYTVLKGISHTSTTIQFKDVRQSRNLITMGGNCLIKDLKIQISLASSGASTLDVKGIVFPGNTASASRIREVVLTVDGSQATNAEGSLVGIEFIGDSDLPDGYTVLKGMLVTVTTDKTKLVSRGLLVSGSVEATAKDVNFVTIGPKSIAIEVVNVEASFVARLIYASGEQADVSQTAGQLTLGMASLFHSTANGFGFVNAQQPYVHTCGNVGLLTTSESFYYTGTTSTLCPVIVKKAPTFYIKKHSLVKGLHVSLSKAPGQDQQITWTVYRNRIPTSLSVTLKDWDLDEYNPLSVTFDTNDALSIHVESSNGSKAENSQVQVEII